MCQPTQSKKNVVVWEASYFLEFEQIELRDKTLFNKPSMHVGTAAVTSVRADFPSPKSMEFEQVSLRDSSILNKVSVYSGPNSSVVSRADVEFDEPYALGGDWEKNF